MILVLVEVNYSFEDEMNRKVTIFAPIVLFVYNRLEHTEKTVGALRENVLATETDLLIFSDGPKNSEDVKKINMLREYIKSIDGFKSVKIVERKSNFGLAKSVISGVSKVVEKYGKVIVVEDDLVTSRYFLKYMNKALDLYGDDEEVISIHGYVYPVASKLPESFFLLGADCWGWATWKRGWDLFEADGEKLRSIMLKKGLVDKFNMGGAYDYMQMLEDQIAKKNDSWAIRWLASAVVNNKYTLYPGRSLVKNIGLDGSGTHCNDKNSRLSNEISQKEIILTRQFVEENKKAKKIIGEYLRGLASEGPRIISYVNLFVGKIKSLVFDQKKYGWFGDYKKWNDVKKITRGYDEKLILDKVCMSLLKVKNGEAFYERDSVLFDKVDYSWPVLSALLWVAAQNNGKLNVIDFGGSLGSSYYQNKKFLDELKSVRWNIVEQDNFVNKGRELFENKNLRFYNDLEQCKRKTLADVIFLSSVIQYVESPFDLLNRILKMNFEVIIVDRTSFVLGNKKDRLTRQVVPPEIYTASYPCWFFNEKKFVNKFKEKYELIESFLSLDKANIESKFMGFIFVKKDRT